MRGMSRYYGLRIPVSSNERGLVIIRYRLSYSLNMCNDKVYFYLPRVRPRENKRFMTALLKILQDTSTQVHNGQVTK